VHDGCRPIVSRDLISDVIRHTGRYDCVVPVVKITSSLKKINEEGNGETVSQENMYYVQTPQGLKFNEVLAVYKQESLNEYNDESSLCSIHKKSVGFVDGSSKNIKITTQEDIIMAQEFDKKSSTIRVGTGFDAHRFANEESEDNFVTLGGIKINCIKKLIAHSDGDVLSHAIVDAMLGAIATGDIGQHFPPTDSKWKNADSRIFLQYADKLIKQKNGEIVNIDATIICQIPKVFPNNTIIAAEIAKTLNINKDQVSIKATTTERMGFTGRKEGIAVHAIVAIRIWE
jgi:2-C-methyl-D-erythritol 4-phosphate cytidylyltransferase/2-C-methyl-D-erythritol 2,4-cyclodiphosphate synthase